MISLLRDIPRTRILFMRDTIIKHISIILFFTLLYFILYKYMDDKGFNFVNEEKKEMTLLDCFYFTLITQTTVGYGHIYPTNIYIKLVNIMQLLTIYGVFVFEI